MAAIPLLFWMFPLAAWLAGSALRRPSGRTGAESFALLVLAAAALLHGGGKTPGNRPRQTPAAPRSAPGAPSPSFSPAETALGFAAADAGGTVPAAVFDPSPPDAAYPFWLLHGAADDLLWTNGVRILSRGLLDFPDGRTLAFGSGDHGIVPAFNWDAAGVTSLFWTAASPTSTVFVWKGTLAGRSASAPVSFRAERLLNGDILTSASPPLEARLTDGTNTVAYTAASGRFADISGLGDGTGTGCPTRMSFWPGAPTRSPPTRTATASQTGPRSPPARTRSPATATATATPTARTPTRSRRHPPPTRTGTVCPTRGKGISSGRTRSSRAATRTATASPPWRTSSPAPTPRTRPPRISPRTASPARRA